MKRTLIFSILGFAVAGCTRTYWTKAGFNQADWNRDTYECERDMRQSGYYGGGLVGVLNAQDFQERCLVARGYCKIRAASTPDPTGAPLTDDQRMERLKNQLRAEGINPNQPPQPETPADAERKKRILESGQLP